MVATEARFHRDAHGVVVSRNPSEAYRHWASYLTVFHEVIVLARVGPTFADVSPVDADEHRHVCSATVAPGTAGSGAVARPAGADPSVTSFPVTGAGVRVVELPPYRGSIGYLRTHRRLRSAVSAGFGPGGLLAPTPRQRGAGASCWSEPRPATGGQASGEPATGKAQSGPAGSGGRSPHVIDTRYIAVMPGLVGSTLIAALCRRGLPYAMEIIGDAEAVAGGMFGGGGRRPARRPHPPPPPPPPPRAPLTP
ncbi:hypothetical protein MXD95_008270, partial [Frankia sp. AiPa1]|nr:hypothetical protein [Frankia sp. AiPa1]